MGTSARHVIDRQLPDYASKGADIQRKVKVGVKGIEMYRMDFSDRDVLTRQSAYINIEMEQGAHMSRLVQSLYDKSGEYIMVDNDLLQTLADSHETDNSYWECHWRTIFDDEKPFAFDISLEGTCTMRELDSDILSDPEYKWFLTMTIPYASVCPCSNEMVHDIGDGVPHMQRSSVKVTGMLQNDDLDYLIPTEASKIAEVVKLVPEPIMKRPDELSWCVRAQQVNLFVEDAARQVAETIDGFFTDFVVVAEHQESIHQHNVVAIYRKGEMLL